MGASENSLIWPLCLSEEKMEREIEQRVHVVPAVMRRELSLFLTHGSQLLNTCEDEVSREK